MRLLSLLLLCAVPSFSQLVSFGVKAGVPLTDFVNAASGNTASGFLNYATHTDRYLFGATGEIHLPFHLGIEVDALYRHENFQASTPTSLSSTSSNAWEFPLLLKYRFGPKIARPFLDAGVSWDTLQGLTQTVQSTINGTAVPSDVTNNTVRGFVLGGGLDFKLLVIHIQPEIRYTRWGAHHFLDPSGLLHSNENQGEFLLGVTF